MSITMLTIMDPKTTTRDEAIVAVEVAKLPIHYRSIRNVVVEALVENINCW